MKSVLVTGGAARIGAAIVEHLSAKGWQVVIHYNGSAEKAQALHDKINAGGGGAQMIKADLKDPAAPAKLVKDAYEASGDKLYGIVNNASVFAFNTPLDFDDAAWQRDMAINLQAPITIARTFKQILPETSPGCVVNMLDQKLWNLNPDFFTYTISKHALYGATKMLAQALAPNLRVCAVAPGLAMPSGGQTREQFEAVAAAYNLAQKPINLKSITSSVEFVLDNDAINGSCVMADNGQHLVSSNHDIMFSSRGNR